MNDKVLLFKVNIFDLHLCHMTEEIHKTVFLNKNSQVLKEILSALLTPLRSWQIGKTMQPRSE